MTDAIVTTRMPSRRLRLLVAVFAAVALLLTRSVCLGESAPLDPIPSTTDILDANGNGTITIEGDYIDLEMELVGRIWVNHPENIFIGHYEDARSLRREGRAGARYDRVRGKVSYTGNNVVLVISGSVRKFHASGSARISFTGRGTITTNEWHEKKWRRQTIALGFGYPE